MAERVDIAVAGGGVAGLAAALALAAAPGPRPRVLVCDPNLGRTAPASLRALAIAPGPRALLDRLGVWAKVEALAQPILRMTLTDSRPGALPAPDLLHFDGEAAPDGALAHMVLQDDLAAALLRACGDAGVDLRPAAVTGFSPVPSGLALEGLGGPVTARLLVAADGARSRLREAAGLRSIGWDYGQSGIVATVAHDRDHAGEAVQHFLPGGPLALLPLRSADGRGHRTSIVWTEARAEAERLAALPPDDFCAALAAHGGHERGALRLEDRPVALPLRLSLARGLTAPRLALLGDAARTIHPLAGQGLNLGLGDAAALARHAGEAMALGLNPGSGRVLDAYARERRPAQVAVATLTDGLNRLFATDNPAARLLRDVGLGLVDRTPALKGWLRRAAAG